MFVLGGMEGSGRVGRFGRSGQVIRVVGNLETKLLETCPENTHVKEGKPGRKCDGAKLVNLVGSPGLKRDSR